MVLVARSVEYNSGKRTTIGPGRGRCIRARGDIMKRFLLAAVLTTAALVWSAPGAAAQSTSCRWVGEGAALLCDDPSVGTPTLSNWDGDGWTTVPAGSGLYLPAGAGGLS